MNFLVNKIFLYPISTKTSIEEYQERIRQLEWEAIKDFIPFESNLLDVGCGAGYSLIKARNDLNCNVQGIDPEPGAHGVGRFTKGSWNDLPIMEGSAENLPFKDATFDVVYSSHVLEHVDSEEIALSEMHRVLKSGGVMIIGMPTAAMSLVGLFSSWFFTTHISIYHFILSLRKKDIWSRFIRIFIPPSHSYPRAKFIFYDLNHYRISNWNKLVKLKFKVLQVIKPGLYPYPDFIQWFPMIKSKYLSSSVFFICRKD